MLKASMVVDVVLDRAWAGTAPIRASSYARSWMAEPFHLTRRVAVVGAGVAGATAAWLLQRRGLTVSVFERHSWLGGRTRTERIDGFEIDAGIQLFGSTFTEFFRLLRATGVSGRVARMPGRDALWRDGRIHEVVYGSVRSMIASGAVPFMTKLRLGGSYLPLLLQHADVLRYDAIGEAARRGLHREDIASWGARELGPDFVECLAAPLLSAHYGLSPEETSAGLYHLLAQQGTDVQVYTLRGGAATYCEMLCEAITVGGGVVHRSVQVESVEDDGERAIVRCADREPEEFEAVVLAVAAPEAHALLGSRHDAMGAWLHPIRYRSTVSIALMLDRPVAASHFGLSLPRRDFRHVAVACVQDVKPGRVPDGQGLIVAFPQPRISEQLFETEAKRVVDAMLPDLKRVYPRLESQLRRVRVYRWPHWNPVFGPGYVERLAAASGVAESGGRVVLAGDYLHVPGIEGAVRSARDAVDRVASRLEP
jgi:protoporphyrinogen/coproporphyrinogen III oxidase